MNLIYPLLIVLLFLPNQLLAQVPQAKETQQSLEKRQNLKLRSKENEKEQDERLHVREQFDMRVQTASGLAIGDIQLHPDGTRHLELYARPQRRKAEEE